MAPTNVVGKSAVHLINANDYIPGLVESTTKVTSLWFLSSINTVRRTCLSKFTLSRCTGSMTKSAETGRGDSSTLEPLLPRNVSHSLRSVVHLRQEEPARPWTCCVRTSKPVPPFCLFLGDMQALRTEHSTNGRHNDVCECIGWPGSGGQLSPHEAQLHGHFSPFWNAV